jgi:hypothetical protein
MTTIPICFNTAESCRTGGGGGGNKGGGGGWEHWIKSWRQLKDIHGNSFNLMKFCLVDGRIE